MNELNDALAVKLQDEGAKSFVNSWNELMAVIESKSSTLDFEAAFKLPVEIMNDAAMQALGSLRKGCCCSSA